MEIKCPITNEVILKITPKGVVQRVNYAEVWFNLDDGSRMRIAMSKNAKKNLRQSQTDELFATIKAQRKNRILSKVLPPEIKEKQLERIEENNYSEVRDKTRSLIKIDKQPKEIKI